MVRRPRLIERLNAGLASGRRLTLISAAAGCGKTTLLSEWVAERMTDDGGRMNADGPLHPSSFIRYPSKVAWLSLDEGDNDPTRFLTYLVAALQTVAVHIGAGLAGLLQSPQPPPADAILTTLLNEITTAQDHFVLVLDDYHVIDTKSIDEALAFLIAHLPPQLHLVIATREDPHLPLARLRARDQLTELRAADLRFTPAEAAAFLNQVMGLSLSAEDIAALETRTEGWIAGLQLAAISMQGHQDAAGFITSFTGSHHFVLDYLVEEVLRQQPESVQTFLLRTSILDRMCGPLCDAVVKAEGGRRKDEDLSPGFSLHPSSRILAQLERANLFVVPLDNERHWYRYHHLFGDLLRQRLGQSLTRGEIAEHHIRASQWYEENGLLFEAFRHATAANDIERAERLIGSREMGLHLHSVVMPILDWLDSLPKTVLDASPRLWVRSATLALMGGQSTGVEEKLQAAEKALHNVDLDDKTRDLIGQMACARATLALTHYDPEAMITQAHRALEYLHPDNLAFRFTASWALTMALKFKGDRAAAARACQESIAISQRSGDMFSKILATYTLGDLQEHDNQLHQAAETYRLMLRLSGDHPQPNAGEMYLGLARIYYQWNDLDAAEQHGRQSLQLTRQYDRVIDRFIVTEVFMARLKLAQGDVGGASAMLAQTEQTARQKNFTLRLPEIAAVQVSTLIRQGQVAAAAELAQQYELPLSRARVLLSQGNPSATLAVLEPLRQQMEARGWADEHLQAMVLQVVALGAHGEKDEAVHLLGEALALAQPGGFIRIFVDEGPAMAALLARMQDEGGRMKAYLHTLLAAFGNQDDLHPSSFIPHPLVEPLSERELEVLRLIAQGLSNQEIGARLFLALDTVKGHNRRIFDKLQVQRRTEAIARARELGLL